MKKNLLLTAALAGVLALATACSSQSTTTATTAAQTTAAETTAAKETAEVKETADAKETTEKADEEKESTMTGTISDNDKKPEGLAEVKDGDKVTVTYTGTVSAVDAFSGTIVSVKAAK